MDGFLDLGTLAIKRQLHALNDQRDACERRNWPCGRPLSWRDNVVPILMVAVLCLFIGGVIGACIAVWYITKI